MGKNRNTCDLANEVYHGCTATYLGLDLLTTLHHPMVLLEVSPEAHVSSSHASVKNWSVVGVGETGWHRLWCTEDKSSAVLQTWLQASVLECWQHCSLDLTRLSSSELMYTNLCCAHLQHLYLYGELSPCCSGVDGDWPKFVGSKDKSSTMETW